MHHVARINVAALVAVAMLTLGQGQHTITASAEAILTATTAPQACHDHYVPDSAVLQKLKVGHGERRFIVISFDAACQVQVSPVRDVTPELASQYHLPASPTPDVAPSQPMVLGSGNSTCRMSHEEHDAKGLILNEADTFQSWAHNGTYITSIWGNRTGMSWAPDGWNGFSNWSSNSIQSPPYSMSVSGGATFEWFGGSYHIVLVNNFGVDGYGNCTITSWSHTGATVPQGFYTIDLSNV